MTTAGLEPLRPFRVHPQRRSSPASMEASVTLKEVDEAPGGRFKGRSPTLVLELCPATYSFGGRDVLPTYLETI